MIAAVQIRGQIGARQDVKDTLKMLNLGKKHACVVVEDTPVTRGMLVKCKDFITFGPVSDDMVKTLQKLMVTKTAHLHPARGGMRSIKRPFHGGGDLGDRGEEMEKLIRRMLP